MNTRMIAIAALVLAIIIAVVLFVIAAAVHAPIGVRTIVREMTAWRGRSLDLATIVFAVLLLALGLRAVAAVV